MTKWEKIECHQDGTYSISSKSGERVTSSLKDLLENVIAREELIESIDKAKDKGKITEECFRRVALDLSIR